MNDQTQLWNEFELQMKQLHFKQARETLEQLTRNTVLKRDGSAADSMSSSKTASRTALAWARLLMNENQLEQAARKADEAASLALENSSDYEQAAAWQIYIAALMGDQILGFSLLKRMSEQLKKEDQNNPGWLSMSAMMLFYETGHYEEAKKTGARLVSSGKSARIRLEASGLLGDLASVDEGVSQALAWYESALEDLDAIPENWRSLRKALICISAADACEHVLAYEDALDWHAKAQSALKEVCDPDLYGMNGYLAESMLAKASCLSMMDDPASALEVLDEVEQHILPKIEQEEEHDGLRVHEAPFWKSRIQYLRGLCHLYQDHPDAAWPLLRQAEQGFKKHLELSKSGNREYLGRAAYYAGSCAPDFQQQKALLLEALEIFKSLSWRDPEFFEYSIGDIYNQLGLESLYEAEAEAEGSEDYLINASVYFAQAADQFSKILDLAPSDAMSASSLLSALLNLANAKPCDADLQEVMALQAQKALNLLKTSDPQAYAFYVSWFNGSTEHPDAAENAPVFLRLVRLALSLETFDA